MGDSSVGNQREYKQQQDYRFSFSWISGYMDYLFGKRVTEMFAFKGMISILNFLGFSLCGYLTLINIENFKAVVFFVVGFLFLFAKFIFYCIRQRQAVRKEAFEQKVRELEYNDRLLRQQEQNIVNMEKELEAQIKLLGKRE